MGFLVTDRTNAYSWSYSLLLSMVSISNTPFSPTIKPAEVACGMPCVVCSSTVEGDTAYTLSAILWSFRVTLLASHMGTSPGIGNCACAGRATANISIARTKSNLFDFMIFFVFVIVKKMAAAVSITWYRQLPPFLICWFYCSKLFCSKEG